MVFRFRVCRRGEARTKKLKAIKILSEGDVLVTIAGAQVGRCGFVRDGVFARKYQSSCRNQFVLYAVKVQTPRFVYYFLQEP